MKNKQSCQAISRKGACMEGWPSVLRGKSYSPSSGPLPWVPPHHFHSPWGFALPPTSANRVPAHSWPSSADPADQTALRSPARPGIAFPTGAAVWAKAARRRRTHTTRFSLRPASERKLLRVSSAGTEVRPAEKSACTTMRTGVYTGMVCAPPSPACHTRPNVPPGRCTGVKSTTAPRRCNYKKSFPINARELFFLFFQESFVN